MYVGVIGVIYWGCPVKHVFNEPSSERTSSDQGTTFQNKIVYLPHVKAPVMKGHLSYRYRNTVFE